MNRPITLRALNRATLARQGLLEPLVGDAASVVEAVGSLQAQHPDWPPFALQTRLDPTSSIDIAEARATRRLVRASLMRITSHVVSAADFWPMSAVSTTLREYQWRAMFKRDPGESPLGRRILAAHPAAVAAMVDRPLAIHEIESVLHTEIGSVDLPGNRCLWRHINAFIPLVQVPFDGERYGRARYVPADTWLPPRSHDAADPDRASRHVAERYLRAFGPASLEDVAAYVGRGRDLPRWRRALSALGDQLVTLRDEAGRELVDLADAPRPAARERIGPRLLARWDSLLVSHATRHRTRVLPEEYRSTVITANADVLPTFLVDGMVAGTWLPRRRPDGETTAELRPFVPLTAPDRRALEAEAERLVPTLAGGAFSRQPGTD